jgi:hypothetical protein
LQKAGIAPTVFAGKKYAGTGNRTVIVITGHTSEELAKYVRELGDAGYFRDNYVVFNSCEAALTEQLRTEITTRYGAAAAFSPEGTITVNSVQQAVLDLVNRVRENKEQNLFRLLNDSFRRNNVHGIWSICRTGNWPVSPGLAGRLQRAHDWGASLAKALAI